MEELNDPIPDAMAAGEQLTQMYKSLWAPMILDFQKELGKIGVRDSIADKVVPIMFDIHMRSALKIKEEES
jgi:hypothetical protein